MSTTSRSRAFPASDSSPSIRPRVEIVLTWLAIAATAATTAMAAYQLICLFLDELEARHWEVVVGQVIFWLIIAFYIYGALVYQFTRLAYLKRGQWYHPATDDEIQQFGQDQPPGLTILVPSYKEEERVVFSTLMSVALQEYSNRRVVLLIDDPPNPSSTADSVQLAASRGLPMRVSSALAPQSRRYRSEYMGVLRRKSAGQLNLRREAALVASLHANAASWFASLAEGCDQSDHAEALFADRVLLWHKQRQLDRAEELVARLQAPGSDLSAEELLRDYQGLVSLFTVEVTSFERKRYENLSHEPNKAMNLNAYVGLVGKSYREREGGGLRYLEEVNSGCADFSVPDADYILTLDADSLVTPDYAGRLIQFMQRPGRERIAVAQTPYNTIPGAPTAIERIAGATTDIQYIIHQGFTGYGATYWVGANAVLRKKALLDLAVEDRERGYRITRFIQDRTVIEDTESSIDLVARGWQLYNYPERLSFSATPSDFGSLIIQRRRWANGGLIILPKIYTLLERLPLSWRLIQQCFMRVHYLVSITAVNFGILLWLLLPTGESMRTLWLPLTALPYYLLYMRDLKLLGYRRRDVLSVYALNLLLIPVNLAGVLKSLEQALTGCKIPFGRTPKIQNRTAAAPGYILFEFGLTAFWCTLALLDLSWHHWLDGAFGLANAAFLMYAILRFVGLKESIEDIVSALPRVATLKPAMVKVLVGLARAQLHF
jgi:cellulose synthase/poly-beta-1,6-N-acetylglucosamine synthase-like glycosyltransferase